VEGIESDERVRRGFQAVLLELLRYRSSLVRLHRIVRRDRHRLKELEKKVGAFVGPN
jgi:hypothetical protein